MLHRSFLSIFGLSICRLFSSNCQKITKPALPFYKRHVSLTKLRFTYHSMLSISHKINSSVASRAEIEIVRSTLLPRVPRPRPHLAASPQNGACLSVLGAAARLLRGVLRPPLVVRATRLVSSPRRLHLRILSSPVTSSSSAAPTSLSDRAVC